MQSLELKVVGMTCSACEQRLATALRRMEGVREATADHTTGRVRVHVAPDVADRSALVTRIENAGFDVAGEESR